MEPLFCSANTTFTFTFPDFDSTAAFLPISPPAPHRRAPRPPQYAPRRRRARHINMREPAQCGLFTVSELPEYEMMSEHEEKAQAKDIFSSPTRGNKIIHDVPKDVEGDNECLNRLSWSSQESSVTLAEGDAETDSESKGMQTPHLEADDPFGWEPIPLDTPIDVEIEMEEESKTLSDPFLPAIKIDSITLPHSATRPRRPPPLTLTTRFLSSLPSLSTPLSSLPPSATSTASPSDSECLLTPNNNALLPPLPIVAEGDWLMQCVMSDLSSPTTPTRPSSKCYHDLSHSISTSTMISPSTSHSRQSPDDTVDLTSALEELLTSCGEQVSSSHSALAEDEFTAKLLPFNVPPSHTPLHIKTVAPLKITPRTPQSKRRPSVTPAAPWAPRKPQPQVQAKRSEHRERYRGSSPTLKGDHSFLTGLSTSEGSSPKSSIRSISSSGRSLPERKGIPLEWTKFAGLKI
ncbi:hypothetical protein IAR55_005352 [Kwoniella newhampshirensis]|uniref:Uncharacterized protein n=1 Tax=Kwoniella newhampshirensis TaxID=1651941 RepID=A0AAW0YM02_9TREE